MWIQMRMHAKERDCSLKRYFLKFSINNDLEKTIYFKLDVILGFQRKIY